jgi:protein-disulfide isomerase
MDAPLTLVEYGDYECPYCGQAYPIVKEVQERLGDDLRFVFRNFPLRQMHPHAESAAEAAEAAAAQDEDIYWEMHDLIYEHQDDLSEDDLQGYASDLGLDAERVASELEEGTHRDRVEEDLMSGARSGVNGTPTFFVNAERFDEDWTDVDVFVNALEDRL